MRVWLVVALGSLVGAGLAAQRDGESLTNAPPSLFAGRPPYRLTYDHLTGRFELRNQRGRVLEQWDRWGAAPAVVGLPPDRPVTIVVENANSLLYTYDVGVSTVAQRNVETCRNVGARLTTSGLIPGLSVVAGTLSPGLLAAKVAGGVLSSGQRETRGQGRVSLSTAEAVLDRLRDPVGDFVDLVGRLSALATSLDDSLATIAELGESQPVDSLLAHLQQSIEQAQPGFGNAAAVPRLLRERTAAVAPLLSQLADLNLMIRDGRLDGDPNAPSAREIVALARRADSAETALTGAYRALQVGLVRIEAARTQSRQTFTTGTSGDVRQLTLTLRPTEQFEGVPRLRQGNAIVYTEPSVSVVCQISLGVAWMDRPPAYDVMDDTILVDVAAGERRAGAQFALALSSPKLPPVGALIGVGIGARQRPDFYLGATLRLFSPILLSGGGVWQWRERLPAGLAPGQVVAGPQVLQGVRRSYRTGVFWSVSLAL